MDERKELIDDIATAYLYTVNSYVDAQTFVDKEWSKIELMVDILVECLARLNKAHKIQFFDDRNWLYESIIDSINERFEDDEPEAIHIAMMN